MNECRKKKTIAIIGWIDVVTYSFLLLFGIRNTVVILIK